MKIIATSDWHGFLPEVPECDILLIAGDICPDKNQERWIEEKFRPWIDTSLAKKIVFIAGNHDFYLERHGFESEKAIYLSDSGTEVSGLRIWGTPWVTGLPRWAFSADEAELRDIYKKIPDDTDILLSHAPVKGILDKVYDSSCGVPALASRVAMTNIKYLISGHIHEEFGMLDLGLYFINASYLDFVMEPRGRAFAFSPGERPYPIIL